MASEESYQYFFLNLWTNSRHNMHLRDDKYESFIKDLHFVRNFEAYELCLSLCFDLLFCLLNFCCLYDGNGKNLGHGLIGIYKWNISNLSTYSALFLISSKNEGTKTTRVKERAPIQPVIERNRKRAITKNLGCPTRIWDSPKSAQWITSLLRPKWPRKLTSW